LKSYYLSIEPHWFWSTTGTYPFTNLIASRRSYFDASVAIRDATGLVVANVPHNDDGRINATIGNQDYASICNGSSLISTYSILTG
jgi:hypothetical protein